MDLGIDGKVALVTAASKGLGRGAAAALAAEGCRVAICARDPERLAETANELPGEILALPADVTEPAAPGGSSMPPWSGSDASTSSSPTPAARLALARWRSPTTA
jgi:NAD(P)-dependent dehydrogenase (short-subunit alcohol dehydrogenase family)